MKEGHMLYDEIGKHLMKELLNKYKVKSNNYSNTIIFGVNLVHS